MIKKWWLSFLILFLCLSQFSFGAPKEKVALEVSLREDSPGFKHFPVGLYWVPKAQMAEVSRAGFNYVIPIPDEITPLRTGLEPFTRSALAYLDAALENGLKCGFYLDKRDLQAYYDGRISWETLAEALRILAAHPALYFHYFRDEPENEENSFISQPPFLEDLEARINELDPVHPTFLVNFAPRVYYKYATIPDIFSIDLYPVPNLPLDSISRALDDAFNATGGQVPVWFTVQAFGNTSGLSRAPSPVELRCMTYLSLARGVEGIQFFRYCGRRWRSLQPVPLWNEMVTVTGELNTLSPMLMQGTKIAASQLKHPAALEVGVIVHGNASYLIAVNPHGKSLEARLELPVNPGQVEVVFEERFVPSEGAGFSDMFEPFDVHIYKLERYCWLHNAGGAGRLEVGRPLDVLLLHNLSLRDDFSYQVTAESGRVVAEGKTGGFFSWTPTGWGKYQLGVRSAAGEDLTRLDLRADYTGAADVWHSYAVRMDAVSPGGEVLDGNGKALALDFYVAGRDDIQEGVPFSEYAGEAHPLHWNSVDSFWSLGEGQEFPYVGKRSTPRFIEFGNSGEDKPLKVHDLAIHPPCGSDVTVVALTIPEAGEYTLLDLGVRKNAGCGDPLVMKFYDQELMPVVTLLSSGRQWVVTKEEIRLGMLEAGQKLYFSMGSLENCNCDFGELRWTLRRLDS